MFSLAPLQKVRVGWWAVPEASSPLHGLRGELLRAEVRARLEGFQPVLVVSGQGPAWWRSPGFTGEPALSQDEQAAPSDAGTGPAPGLEVMVASGPCGSTGAQLAAALAEAGTAVVGVAPEPGWGMEPQVANIGPPFGVPEPTLLASRHFPRALLEARGAHLRVVEGLPSHYVLVEGDLLNAGSGPAGRLRPAKAWSGSADLEVALGKLADRAGRPGHHLPAEVVALAPGPLVADDPSVASVLRQRRKEAEEARHLAEDWPGDPDRPRLPLRVTSPLDLAAAVANAGAVVACSGALLALAWALGVPHVAIADEGTPASDFAAWTGDASALVGGPSGLAATVDNIFARRGSPPGLKRLEATLDESLDQAAMDLEEAVAKVGDPADGRGQAAAEARLRELATANDALRQRLAAERQRFGERAALLEKAAETSVESAIKAYRGQDVIVRRRLEETEREMHRLQEETAVQRAELRAIYASRTWKTMTPAREFYGRLRKMGR